MATKPTESAEELRDELTALRADLSALVETVKGLGRDSADSAIHSAKEAVDHATRRLKMSAEEARERGEAAAGELEAMVTRHPMGAIFAALGVGYILGKVRH